MNSNKNKTMQLVWDLPIRVFHWCLVILITTSVVTGKIGSLDSMDLHFYSGYGVLTLLLFRLVWGLWGTRHARFINFLRGPGAVISYLRSFTKISEQHHIGHNPAGGWMVMLMLGVCLLQAGAGLFITDDIFVEAPLAHLVSTEQQSFLGQMHDLGYKLILALIALHLLALLAHFKIRKENLVPSMLHGKKLQDKKNLPDTDLSLQPLVLAVALCSLSGLTVFWIVTQL